MSPVLLVLCAVLGSGIAIGDKHGPCKESPCGDDEDCKVRHNPCFKPPCPPPYSQCVTIVKAGSCPPDVNRYDKCVDACDTDVDCPRDWKCCGLCPRECKPPYKRRIKPGLCPPIAQCPESLPYCPLTSQCKTDQDCVGPKKCCGRCPKLCIVPESDD